MTPSNRVSKYQPIWTDEIERLEQFFFKASLPEKIELSKYEVIHNPTAFIASHLLTVTQNNGNPYFSPYLERLQRVEQFLNHNHERVNP